MYFNIVAGIARALVPAGVAFLSSTGMFTDQGSAAIVTSVTALLAAAWSVKSNLPNDYRQPRG